MPQVINTVTKAAPTDNYAVVNDTDLKGSYRIVANLTQRDAIVSNQRVQAMLVFSISDLHFYQLQSDLLTWTDLGLSLGGGFAPPILRYVYLVNDISDAARMGGTSNNTYTTFQSAYDAAVVLQVALGGTNKVVVKVGVTTAAVVGNLVLTAASNNNILFVGINSNSSFLGTITSTTFLVSFIFTNITVGVITVTDGGAIALTLRNSVSGNIVTSTTAAANTSTIVIQNSYNSTIGTITATSAISNIGSLTYNTCSNVTTGAISMTQTSAVASFSIGNFIMNNCDNCRFTSSTTITMAFVTSTGIIGGLIINSTNQSIIFTGIIRITGYANTSTIASDVVIANVTCFNTTFGGGFFLNNRSTGIGTQEGGVIAILNIQRCIFRSRARIMYHNANPIITGLNFRISDCVMKGTTDGSRLDFTIQNTNVSFDSFVIDSCQCNFVNSLGVSYNQSVPPTVPFTIDGVSIIFNNITSDSFGVILYNTATTNSVDDVIVSACEFKDSTFNIIDGNVNFNIVNTSTSNLFYLASNGTTPIKRTKINNCILNSDSTNIHLINVPLLLKTTYLGYYTNAINPNTLDIIAYNSFIESFSEVGSVTTWNGTLYTSTLKRLITDSVVGVTFNNSYEEVI